MKKQNLSVMVLGLIFTSVSWAKSVDTDAAAKKRPQKVNIKNLEKRYWAPKDRAYKVVQNRTYTKTNKFYLSLMPSFMLNEEYSKGFGLDLSLGYFFNDRWGVELEYQSINLDDNDLMEEVVALGAFPDHGKSTGYYGLTGKWMPFYAKMSFLGSKIVYFDLSFGATLGILTYEQQFKDGIGELSQSSLSYGIEISQSFYLSKKLLIRADYKHRFYNEEIIASDGGSGSVTGARGSFVEDRLEDSISLNVGLTYIF